MYKHGRTLLFLFVFVFLFSLSAAAATYEIPHDDEVEQMLQMRSQKYSYSREIGGYRSYNAYDATDALRDDLYFYEVTDANRDSRLRKDINKGFEKLADKDTWFVRRELCRDWDWMYDAVMLRVDDSHDFFRFVKSCDDDPGFYDWWFNHWEGAYYGYGEQFPPWLLPQDGSRACMKAKNYQQFLDCRNAYLPHYRADWPSGYFNLTGTIDYGENAYRQWADYCAVDGGGFMTEWCMKRRWWIEGNVNN